MSSPFMRKHATGTGADIIIPMIKAGVIDFSVAADWTPAAGDVKISKDGGAAANIATLPVFLTDIGWKFVFSDAELTAARINVNIVDSATKAVEDQHLIIETYGNASAQHAFDLDTAVQDVNVASMDAGTVTAAAIATGAIDADALATDAVDEIVDAVWDEDIDAAHQTANTAGKRLDDSSTTVAANLDATVSSRSDFDETADPVELLDTGGAAGTSASELVDDVWDEAIAGHLGAGSTGEALDNAKDAADAAAVADAVWDEARSGHVGAGSFGEGVLVEDLNAAAKASVNAEVVDVLKVDTIPEQTQGVPPATPTFEQAQAWFWATWRNSLTASSSEAKVRNTGGTVLAKAPLSDAAGEFKKDKFVSGP